MNLYSGSTVILRDVSYEADSGRFCGFMAGSLLAQEKPQLVALASLLTNPEHYLGQTVATQAIVDESNATAGTLKLTEIKTAGGTKKSEFLSATWSRGDGNPFPQNGQEAIVIGQIQIKDKAPILQASNIVTDKEAIRRFVRPFERRPRPGDNLGRDAQPSSHLSE
jgi:hypothetical protein